MKKTMILLTSMMLLTACQKQDTFTGQVDNGDEIVISCQDNLSITRQKVYEDLASSYGANYLVNLALQKAASFEVIDNEKVNQEVENTIETYKTLMGDDLDAYAKANLGFDTFETYKEKVLVPSMRQKLMIENYSEENFEKLAKENSYVKLRMIKVNDQQTAVTVIGKISSDEISFEDAVKEYSTDSTTKSKNGELSVVSILSTNVDSSIASLTPQLTAVALYSAPVTLSDGTYAIIDVQETDINVLKDDILKDLKVNDSITQEAEAFYLNKYNFKVSDPVLKKAVQEINKDYIK